ncbi:PAS domain S-box protein [Labilibaculum sp. DW002]|uniref:histidine kinase n=1 Tax=Paralabilibaculum antarcticum TaxID=2912572 RepID=A0ABT5VPQ2_9BACT|nr:PAS domain S-box protein [Labilibaculum sp. DW002]MDE5417416.1 PAS domain S-box protein [Labilibaculum sp. DW002]
MNKKNQTKEELLIKISHLESKNYALEKSELKKNIWFENSPVCTKLIDLEFNLKYINKSGIRDLKINDITEFYGKPYPLSFFPDSFKISMIKKLKRAKETGETITLEAPTQDMEGNTLWYHSTIVPVYNDHKQLDHFMLVSLETKANKQAEEALKQSEATIKNKLKAITEPHGDISTLELSDIIDTEILQSLMEDFYQITGMLGAVLDISGKVLVAVGWQDICTKFHRCNPDTLKNCIESDTILTQGVPEGTCKAYHCKNNMWDIVTPIVVGGKHVGNVFMGQYFLEGEVPNVEIFRKQAKKFGFDEKEYLAALDRVPRFSKETVDRGIKFYSKLAGLISTLSFSTIQQSKMLAQQKLADQALRESEKKYRDLINLAQEGIWVIDKNNITTFANPSMADMLGYSSEEMIGKSLFDFMDETGIKIANENIEHRKAGLKEQHDFEFICKNGNRIFCTMTTAPIIDKSGNYQGTIAGVIDITERKKAEEILKDGEERFKTILDSSPFPIAIVDKNKNILFWSISAKQLFGHDPKTSQEWFELAYPNPDYRNEVIERFKPLFELAVKSTKAVSAGEYRIKCKDGSTKICELYIQVIHKNLIITTNDITERKQVEEEIRIAEERFELAMAATKDGLYDWNLETNEIYYSPGWKNMLGYDDDELPNDFSVWENLIEPADAEASWKMQQELINKQRNHFELEFKMKHKKGHWVDILSRAEIFYNDKGKAIRMVGTHVDISERKHEEKILDVELKMFEYSINHSEEELLQKFLDEAEELTGSEIGFYHYIEDDQESISLQAWSSNTLNKMCKGLGESSRHYPISEAGVWMDCVKERKPVIHNDYSSLTHKKGLPEGHAPMIRELVVPVIRGNQIMAVLGVGNKKSDYNEADVKTVQRLADITWETAIRKQAEENLKNTFDISPSIISKANVDTGYFIEANQAVTRLLGYTTEEFTSKPLMEFIHPDDKQRTVDEIVEQKDGRDTTFFENRYLCKDGSYKWMAWHSTKADENGIVTAIASDISERKIIEQEIVETKQFYENIIEGVQDGIWVTDKNDVIFYANSAMEKIAGVPRDQIQGNNVLKGFPEETIVEFSNFYKQAKKEKKPVWYEVELKTPTKKDVCQNGWLIPQYQNNVFSGIICTVRDISERKKAEGSVRKLSTAVQQSPSSIAISDTNGKLEYVNPKYTELTGYSSAESIGRQSNIFKSDEQDDLFFNEIWKTVDSGKVWRGQFHNKKKNGELFWEAASISAILNESGEIINYIKIGEDITQQKNTEAELKIALEKALESDRLKSAFLANMSHEIRTPMNGILGFVNLLNEPNLRKSKVDEYSAIINKSGERLLNTINDIIDISKIEAGEMLIANTETSINNIMEELLSFFTPEASMKGLSLAIEPSLSAEQPTVITDSNKLHGILSNLIKNAIKYTEKGHITFGYLVKEGFIEFSVKDTGVGIPKDRLQAIFNRFEQADIEDSKVFEGSGLGLAISKAYAEMLGGDIFAESTVGKGSKFEFTIPYVNAIKKKTEQYPGNFKNIAARIEDLNLLVVEDDETSSELLKYTLLGLFKEIIFVDNGKDAIETCRINPEIDLVLMDIKMPKMNGYDATTEIRKFNKDLIIIAQTAYALRGDREKAIEVGCDDYITKPINKVLLLDLINKLIG